MKGKIPVAIKEVMPKIRRSFASLPIVMRVGLILVGLGGAIDLVYHLGSGAPASNPGTVGTIGHLVTLAGMVVAMLGLIEVALRKRPARSQDSDYRRSDR